MGACWGIQGPIASQTQNPVACAHSCGGTCCPRRQCLSKSWRVVSWPLGFGEGAPRQKDRTGQYPVWCGSVAVAGCAKESAGKRKLSGRAVDTVHPGYQWFRTGPCHPSCATGKRHEPLPYRAGQSHPESRHGARQGRRELPALLRAAHRGMLSRHAGRENNSSSTPRSDMATAEGQLPVHSMPHLL